MVDANDRDRMDVAYGSDSSQSARGQLHSILNEPMLRNVVVMILANKSDLPNALPLDTGLFRKYHVFYL
jgi:hypothetical protein